MNANNIDPSDVGFIEFAKALIGLMVQMMLAPPYEDTFIVPAAFVDDAVVDDADDDDCVNRCQYYGACDGKQCHPCRQAIASYIDPVQRGGV